MAFLLPAAYNLGTSTLPCKKTRLFQPLQVKAQRYRDDHEGRSSEMVNANLGVLRMRIEEAKKKERLERCFVAEQGWNYRPTHNFKGKRNTTSSIIHEFGEVVGMISATFGLTILSCSFCLCIASLFIHLNQ